MNSPEAKKYTLEEWLNKARRATISTDPKAAELIASKVLKLNRTKLLTETKTRNLSPKNLRKLNNQLGKLLAGRPLSAVLKSTHFHNISLKINPRVLSPRAETEEIVEYAIKNIPQSATVLDIGTGSGAIGISIAKSRPDLTVMVTDIDRSTLNLAKLNARRNKVRNIDFKLSNLIKKIDQNVIANETSSTFFIANLPYVDQSWEHIDKRRLSFEPYSALFSGNHGLELIYNLITQLQQKNAFTNKNWLLLEHDPIQFDNLSSFCTSNKLQAKKITDFISLIKK